MRETDAVVYGNVDVDFTFTHHLGRVTEGGHLVIIAFHHYMIRE